MHSDRHLKVNAFFIKQIVWFGYRKITLRRSALCCLFRCFTRFHCKNNKIRLKNNKNPTPYAQLQVPTATEMASHQNHVALHGNKHQPQSRGGMSKKGKHRAGKIARLCIGPRRAVHRPSQGTASTNAPHYLFHRTSISPHTKPPQNQTHRGQSNKPRSSPSNATECTPFYIANRETIISNRKTNISKHAIFISRFAIFYATHFLPQPYRAAFPFTQR